MRKTICFTVFVLAATSAVAQGTERRCGWVNNPTPANWWIEDSDASWQLFGQGDESFFNNGFMDLPENSFQFGEDWVRLNNTNDYGYGCGCVEGTFSQGFAVSIEAMEPLPLSRCEADPELEQR